jgi:CSLREA domain-containing protein
MGGVVVRVSLRRPRFLLLVVLAALLALSSSGPAAAQAPRGNYYFFVASTVDAVDADPGDGFCSSESDECTLRAAIMEANALGGVPVFVDLPPGEYVLTIEGADEDAAATGDLDILVPIDISGTFGLVAGLRERGGGIFQPLAVTIDANGIDRALDIEALGGPVELDELIIVGGAPIQNAHGGALRASTEVLLRSVELRDNAVTGSGSGGAIYAGSGANVSLEEVSIVDNEAFAGGGIRVEPGATVNVNYSLLSDNDASLSGGGIANGGTLNVLNATLSANTADVSGGGIYNTGTAVVRAATVAFNQAPAGANIFDETGATASLHSSIISGGATGTNCAGPGFTSLGYNVESTDTCNLTQLTDEKNVNPQLAPLGDNGGFTWTHALLPTSPAIDQVAVAECLSSDQRFFERPAPDFSSPTCDAGAYEAGTAWFVVTTTADGQDATPGDGYCATSTFPSECTLRAAVQETNILAGSDYVILPEEGPYRLGLIGANEDAAATGDIDITDDLTVLGAVPEGGLLLDREGEDAIERAARGMLTELRPVTVIDGNRVDRIFETHGSSEVTIAYLVLREGYAPKAEGGAIFSEGDLTAYFLDVLENEAGAGGGLAVEGDFFGIFLNIHDNVADYGGGLFNDSSDAEFAASVVGPNLGSLAGGGIYNAGSLYVHDATILGNESFFGGGVYNQATFVGENLTISGNQATGDGGGLVNGWVGDGSTTTDLNNVTITDNDVLSLATRGGPTPTFSGGGIFNYLNDVVTLSNTIVADNSAPNGPECAGTLTSQGFNLIGDLTGCTFISAGGDITNTDAQLAELLDVYFGYIFVHPLQPGSPALDGGNPAIPGSGADTCVEGSLTVERPAGEACDIGAVEMAPVDLQLTLESEPEPVVVGQELNVQATVSNPSKTAADPATLTIAFDQEVEISYLDSRCEENSGAVVCELFVGEAGQEISIGVIPSSTGQLGIHGEVSVSGLYMDTDETNNSDEITATVEDKPTATATASPTETATPSSTPTSEPSPTGTPSVTPSETPSVTPSATPTSEPGLELFEGWNPVDPWTANDLEGTAEIIAYLNDHIAPPVWESVAHYDDAEDEWQQTFRVAPLPSFNTLLFVNQGAVYWLFVTDSALLTE